MTLLDAPAERTAPPAPKRPGVVWLVLALAIVSFVVGIFGLSFQSKLGDVQKNDNSAFLPSSADSTKVSNESEKFNSTQTIPGNIVYQRKSGLTAADKQAIGADRTTFGKIKNVAADQIGVPVYSQNGQVASISVPLVGKQNGVSAKGPDLVDAEKAVIKAARANAPSGLVVHSSGAGGILVAFIDSFSGLDGTLLFSAGIVVVLLLLLVYRSPVL
jgi:putative drug exporter of the RND superfamily